MQTPFILNDLFHLDLPFMCDASSLGLVYSVSSLSAYFLTRDRSDSSNIHFVVLLTIIAVPRYHQDASSEVKKPVVILLLVGGN